MLLPVFIALLQATQEVVSRIPLTTAAEFNAAVQAAKDAFPAWRATPVPTRQRVMLKFQELIRQNWVSRISRQQASHTMDGEANHTWVA
jgi:acyl-CoA reductase-like NAD-dependent aldehyde dehydrogenase